MKETAPSPFLSEKWKRPLASRTQRLSLSPKPLEQSKSQPPVDAQRKPPRTRASTNCDEESEPARKPRHRRTGSAPLSHEAISDLSVTGPSPMTSPPVISNSSVEQNPFASLLLGGGKPSTIQKLDTSRLRQLKNT